MKLYNSGVYLVNGRDIIEEAQMTEPVSREDAAREYNSIQHPGSTQHFWKHAETSDQI